MGQQVTEKLRLGWTGVEHLSASWTRELSEYVSDWLSFSSGTLFDGFGLGTDGFLSRSWVESDTCFYSF